MAAFFLKLWKSNVTPTQICLVPVSLASSLQVGCISFPFRVWFSFFTFFLSVEKCINGTRKQQQNEMRNAERHLMLGLSLTETEVGGKT